MELLIPLDLQSTKPLYEQIYAYIRGEIRSGALRTEERLPSTRVLAEHLKVSRSTTQMAYEQLLAEGYIEAEPYRGYYVSQIEELVDTVSLPETETLTGKCGEESGYEVDFSPRGIDLESFPYNTWRKLTRNTLVDDNREMFHSGDHQGEPGLREAIRGYLHSARGVNCRPEQIIVGAGSEYLLMLLSQVLGSGRKIAMENPTYRQACRVFNSLGYHVCPVEMDGDGMDAVRLAEGGADLAYVMPSHQYPTGVVMSVRRRQELLRWAGAKAERYLIEDDYDSEFRYKGKPIPALQGMDTAGKVIYLGTFSKCIAPAIRVSYLVLPPSLYRRYRDHAGFYASTVSRIDQNVLYQFLKQGYFERHLNRMRAIYKAKHDVLLSELRPLENDFIIQGEYAGIHILLTHRGGWSEEDLITRAAEAGVRVYGLSSYYIDPAQECREATVIIGYASLGEDEIRKGIRRLIRCWKRETEDRGGYHDGKK